MQGCSPGWVDACLRVACVLVPNLGSVTKLLLYAGDLTLRATSKEDLIPPLDCLREFSAAYCCEVNVPKCAVAVFGKTAPKRGTHAFCRVVI